MYKQKIYIRKWPSPLKDKWPNCLSRSCHKVSLIPRDPGECDRSWSFIGHLTSADAKLLPQTVIDGAKGISEFSTMVSLALTVALRIAALALLWGSMLPFPLTIVLFSPPDYDPAHFWENMWHLQLLMKEDLRWDSVFCFGGPPFLVQWVHFVHPLNNAEWRSVRPAFLINGKDVTEIWVTGHSFTSFLTRYLCVVSP